VRRGHGTLAHPQVAGLSAMSMDHSLSPHVDELMTELAQEIGAVGDQSHRQHLIQEFINRLSFRTIVFVPPDDVSPDAIPILYRVVAAAIDVIKKGATALSVTGRTKPNPFVGVPTCGDEIYNEDIEIVPDGGSFVVASVGPFAMHVPTWVDHHMATELAGILWRVMRFCLRGDVKMDGDFEKAAKDALAPAGKQVYARQYVALGYVRWLLTAAGIRTYDVFGNEVTDTPEFYYGKLFQKPESMPADLAKRTAALSEMLVDTLPN